MCKSMRAVPGGKAPGRESGRAPGALRRKRPAAVAAQRCQRAARQAAVGLLRRAPAALGGLRTLVQVGQERRGATQALSLQTWGAQRWTPACARAQTSAHTCWALRHSMPLNTGAALASAAAASSRYAARALVGSAAAARLVGARSGRAPMLRAPGGTAELGDPLLTPARYKRAVPAAARRLGSALCHDTSERSVGCALL